MSSIERDSPLADERRGLDGYLRSWTEAALSTAPADRGEAEAGVHLLYRAAGLPSPRAVVWCDGPMDLTVQRERDWRLSRPGANVKVSVFDRVISQITDLVQSVASRHPIVDEAASWPSDLDTTRRAVLDAVERGASLATRGWRIQRIASWLAGIGPPIPWKSITSAGWTQLDAGTIWRFEFMRDALGLEWVTDPLRGIWKITRSAGWIVPHENVCWLSERPQVLRRDVHGRLHATDGPALRYPDGFTQYAWKGVTVPACVIEQRASIKPAHVDREHDPLVRRCMIEIMTPQRYIAEGGASRFASDETGTLWCKQWVVDAFVDAWAAVEVVNGTPEPDGSRKHYFLQVPGHIRTAREAVAWTYGLSAKEYARLSRRT